MRYRRGLVFVLTLAVGLLCGCQSMMKRMVADSMVGMLEEVDHAIQTESSVQYGREAGASLLKMLDGVIASSPNNCALLAMGTRQNAQYALSFIEAEDEDFARSLYSKSVTYGLRALGDPALNAAMKQGASQTRAALRRHGRDQVGLLFWTGLAYGGRISMSKEDVRALADLPIALAFMDRVLELDPSYFYGGAYLFKAQYYGSRSRELGGDPEKALGYFQAAIAQSQGRFLLAKVKMVRYYAIPTQNRAMFEEILQEVLAAPDDILPAEPLATAIAKAEAETLLFEADDYFLAGP